MGFLADSEEWGRLSDRLDSAESDHERLALLGHFVDRNELVIRSLLPANERLFIAAIDPYDRSRADFVRALREVSSRVAAVRAAVVCAVAFDRQLARKADERVEAFGEEAAVCWGPFGHGESGPLFLVRWARTSALPIDKEGLLTKVLANHRVMGRGPGGIAWSFARLGETLPPGRRANLALLLGRSASNWPIRIAVWPGSAVASAEFATFDGCAVVDPDSDAADKVVADALEAVEHAERCEAQLLVAPELFVPEARLGDVAGRLATAGRRGFPVLSVFGLTHRARGDGWVNEAVVLDYQGTETWRHRKLAAFATGDGPGECLPGSNLSTSP